MDGYGDPDPNGVAPDADHYRAPLLLHSLAEFRELIFRCLDAATIASVAEVGAEDGHFTSELLRWSNGSDVRVVAIDPAPSPPLVELANDEPRLELISATSHEALPALDPLDAYLIDGDHNYYTVVNELRIIGDRSDRPFPIVFMHDVTWPCARRDFYYAPDVIPADARHDYSFDHGIVPGNAGVVPGGLRGEGEFAVALAEGGPRNGVQTAIDDFLADRPDVEYHAVPCVFGLGVLYPRDAPYAEVVTDIVRRYEEEPLIRRLERNRLEMYITILGGEDRRSGPVGEMQYALELTQQALEQAGLHIRDLETENKALWARQHELETRADRAEDAQKATEEATDRLARTVRQLLQARSYRLADLVARRHAKRGGLSRRDVERLLDELGG